jgi:hypothetical protein
MNADRKKPGVAFWATVVVGLVAYPVSFGPACSTVRSDDQLDDVTATAMRPGSYAVGSAESSGNGFFRSDNMPKEAAAKDLPKGKHVALVAHAEQVVRYGQHSRGIRMVLVNGTDEAVRLPACDSEIRVIQEARDASGNWRPIESVPESFCGNSYHVVTLKPGHLWELAAPKYAGALKTKLRFVLKGKEMIYSNEFDGSIDPGQFERKAGTKHPINDARPAKP